LPSLRKPASSALLRAVARVLIVALLFSFVPRRAPTRRSRRRRRPAHSSLSRCSTWSPRRRSARNRNSIRIDIDGPSHRQHLGRQRAQQYGKELPRSPRHDRSPALRLYLATSVVAGRMRRADRFFAASLFDQRVSLYAVEYPFVVAAARRIRHNAFATPLPPIRPCTTSERSSARCWIDHQVSGRSKRCARSCAATADPSPGLRPGMTVYTPSLCTDGPAVAQRLQHGSPDGRALVVEGGFQGPSSMINGAWFFVLGSLAVPAVFLCAAVAGALGVRDAVANGVPMAFSQQAAFLAGALGVAGASACARVANKPDWEVAPRGLVCALATRGLWTLFLGLAAAVAVVSL
jgi:hypothetical protein